MDDAAFQHAAAVALALNTRAARVSEKQQLAQLNQSLHLGNAAGPQQQRSFAISAMSCVHAMPWPRIITQYGAPLLSIAAFTVDG
jgi:hypothetical protein